MAIKPIIEIDLPTEKLREFVQQYKEFKEALAQQPSEWAAAGASIEAATEQLEKLLAAHDAVGDAQGDAIEKGHRAAVRAQGAQARQAQIDEAALLRQVREREAIERRIGAARPRSAIEAAKVAERQTARQVAQARRAAPDARTAADLKRITDARDTRQEDRKDLSDFGRATEGVNDHFAQMAKSTHAIVTNIKEATVDFLKWSGIITAFTGLVGAGGLFGIDRLAMGVLDNSRQAKSLGVTMGERSAFGVNFAPFLEDPTGTLGRFADAKSNLADRWALSSLGLGNYPQEDPARLASEAMIALKRQMGSGPLTQQEADARGWTKLFSMSELRTIQATPMAQLQSAQSQFGKDSRSLGLSDPIQKEWTAFAVELKRAGAQIGTTFIAGLAPLTPMLTNLSDDLAELITTFLKMPATRSALEGLNAGLKDLDAFLRSKQFREDLQDFQTEFGDLVKWLKSVAADVPAVTNPKGSPGDKMPGNVQGWSPFSGWDLWGLREWLNREFPAQPLPHFDPDTGKAVPTGYDPMSRSAVISNANYETAGAASAQGDFSSSQFGAIEEANGLPAGLLTSVMKAESGGNPNAVSPAGAEGLFQFMPATAAQYDIDPFDPMQAARGAGRKFKDLLAEFAGNLKEAVAAYNWGDGNLKRDIAKHGDDWFAYAPRETQAYVGKVLGGTSGGSAPAAPVIARIRVENRTGGSAVISMSTVAV